MLPAESLRCSKARSLTFKLQAALGLLQELPMVEHSADQLLEGCGGGKEREREKKRKIKLFSEIMFNVEIWLILKCNLQFSSVLFLKENISCSRGRSSKQSLITSLPMSGPLTFTVYYRIDNANFRMVPSPPTRLSTHFG